MRSSAWCWVFAAMDSASGGISLETADVPDRFTPTGLNVYLGVASRYSLDGTQLKLGLSMQH